jgi:rubredoxin
VKMIIVRKKWVCPSCPLKKIQHESAYAKVA